MWYWVLLLGATVLLTLPGAALLRRALVGNKRAGVACDPCGFDLTGSRGTVKECPECGSPIVEIGERPPIGRGERAWCAVLALLLLLPLGFTGIAGTAAFRRSAVCGQLFPRVAAAPASGLAEWELDRSAATTLRAYATDGLSEEKLREALKIYTASLSDAPVTSPAWDWGVGAESGSGKLIRSVRGLDASSAIAALLDDRGMSEQKYTALIDALADAYEEAPISHTTQVDDSLLDLMMQRRAKRYSSSSGDYQFTDPMPRALTVEQRNRLISMILAIQGDPNRLWSSRWGQAFEHAAASGDVSDADVRRYLDQVFNPEIVVPEGTELQRGDVVTFMIEPGWRNGAGMPVYVRATGAKGAFEGRVAGPITIGAACWATESSFRYEGQLLLPDTTGKVVLDLELEIITGPPAMDAVKARINPSDRDEDDLWRKFPTNRIRKRATLELELIDTSTPATIEDDAGVGADRMISHVGGVSLLCETEGEVSRLEGFISFRYLPVDVAFDVFLRQAGQEFPLGWVCGARVGMQSTAVGGTVRGFDPSIACEVVLRSDKGRIERGMWIPKIWKGELVLKDVRVRKGAVPAAPE